MVVPTPGCRFTERSPCTNCSLSRMAVPNQMADSFLCQKRKVGVKAPELKKNEAKYGAYYLSASQLNFGEEQSPALLLLWTQQNKNWKVAAWAVDVP